jgi:hypothetical protein
MRATVTVLAACLVLEAGAACAPGGGDDTDVSRREDGRVEADVAVDVDAETAACTSSAECDDHITCTQDTCLAGGVCGHHALDALCAADERCSETEGCVPETCTTDGDCSDGVFCNGDEVCAGTCFPDPAGRDCNDGNVCTDDRCDTALYRCVHDPLAMEGCESDGGDASVPFDPLVHYSGDFWLAPPQSQACGVSYSIDTVTFVRSDADLQVWGAPCSMRQAPPPTDASFSVTCTKGCGTYSLSGTFTDSDNFTGHWTASFSGCPSCSRQDVGVIGARI